MIHVAEVEDLAVKQAGLVIFNDRLVALVNHRAHHRSPILRGVEDCIHDNRVKIASNPLDDQIWKPAHDPFARAGGP